MEKMHKGEPKRKRTKIEERKGLRYVCGLCFQDGPVTNPTAHACPSCTFVACTSGCALPHDGISCGHFKIESKIWQDTLFPHERCFNCGFLWMVDGTGKHITCPGCKVNQCWVHKIEVAIGDTHFCGYSLYPQNPLHHLACHVADCKHNEEEGACMIDFPDDDAAFAFSVAPHHRRLHIYNFRLILMAARHHVDKGVSSIYDIIHLDEYQRMIFAFLR